MGSLNGIEDDYLTTEHPERSADLVIAGDPRIEHDPDVHVIVRPHPE
jgi:hypothetical protein